MPLPPGDVMILRDSEYEPLTEGCKNCPIDSEITELLHNDRFFYALRSLGTINNHNIFEI